MSKFNCLKLKVLEYNIKFLYLIRIFNINRIVIVF